MKPWIKRSFKRSLIGLFGGAVLLGGLAACSHHRMHDGAMSEADIAQMRERFIDKASRELTLDEAQKAKLGGLADAVKAQRAALMAGGANPCSELAAGMAADSVAAPGGSLRLRNAQPGLEVSLCLPLAPAAAGVAGVVGVVGPGGTKA